MIKTKIIQIVVPEDVPGDICGESCGIKVQNIEGKEFLLIEYLKLLAHYSCALRKLRMTFIY